MLSLCIYEYWPRCVWNMNICVLPLFVYSTLLGSWECTCVNEVGCSICIHTSIDVLIYICILVLVCLNWNIHIHVATNLLLSSAYLLGVWLCAGSGEFDEYTYMYGYCRNRIYIMSLFDIYACVWYICIYCHYSWKSIKMVLGCA